MLVSRLGCSIVLVVEYAAGIEIAALNDKDLDALARKTKVLINTVGPYYLYSSPVIKACASNGTHYLDVTGESPWVLEMIDKYHEIAKANHAIIIPQIGIESAPSDLLVFTTAKLIRRELSVGVREVIGCVHDVSGLPSGGTLATALGIIDHYSLKDVARSGGSWASSPVPGPRPKDSLPLLNRIFGTRFVPGLGYLTSSISAGPNVATVQRSWGLLDGGKIYGPRFSYQEYAAVRNPVIGTLVHFAMILGALALALSPVRWLLKKVTYAPGQGATKEATNNDHIEFRAIANADQGIANPSRAAGRLRWDGGNYLFTGMCLAEAAMVLLREHDLVDRLDGGILTPALIAEPLIDLLTSSGVVLEARMLP